LQKYNAASDSFYSEAEIFDYIYTAETELCGLANCIEGEKTQTSVVSQQAYTMPTNAIAIKRITHGGKKLTPIDARDDDDLTILNQHTEALGSTQFYYQWDGTFYLRPVPDTAATMIVWSFNYPERVTASIAVSVPVEYHAWLSDYCVWRMSLKDENSTMAREYRDIWQSHVVDVQKQMRRKKVGDSFKSVKDVDRLAITRFGVI